MVSEDVFLKSMTTMLTGMQVEMDKDLNRFYYEQLKNDFTDDEIKSICSRLMKEELAYNKYPPISLFYKGKVSKEDVELAKIKLEFNEFFNIVAENLQMRLTGFDGSDCTPLQQQCLKAFGGFGALYTSVHREDGYPRTVASIKKDLETWYLDNYSINKTLQLTNDQPDKRIQDLTRGIG